MFPGENLDIKVNKYGHEVNDYSVQCSLLIKCAELLIFLSKSNEIKSGAWVNNSGNGAFGVTGQLTKRSPFAVL